MSGERGKGTTEAKQSDLNFLANLKCYSGVLHVAGISLKEF